MTYFAEIFFPFTQIAMIIKDFVQKLKLVKDQFHDRTITGKEGGAKLKQVLFTWCDQGPSSC